LRLEEFEREFSGIPAVILQHEIDHNFGRERMIDTIGRRIFLSC
jgi:peptide deformylase